METVMLARPAAVDTATAPPTWSSPAETMVVTATYALSEAGRKASLLAGGTGRAVQQQRIGVPAHRLHLVRVNGRGVAQLSLRPRYDVHPDQRVVLVDALPIYDHPPTAEDLLRDAAQRHQRERAYQAGRSAARATRAEADRTRRTEIAAAFLHDATQRAQVHPAPSPRRCVLVTPAGPVTFDVASDEGLGKDVPAEALRRFRADLPLTASGGCVNGPNTSAFMKNGCRRWPSGSPRTAPTTNARDTRQDCSPWPKRSRA